MPAFADARSIHLLHVMPGFGLGGMQVRTAQIMNYLGAAFRHTVVSLSGDFGAAERVNSSLDVRYANCPKSWNPMTMICRLARFLTAERPHLVLTYNWGSIDAVAAAGFGGIGPLIHTEDGFGPDEAHGLKTRRGMARNLLLRAAHRVVAPSLALVNIMQQIWCLPAGKVEYIPNGIDVDLFSPVDRPLSDLEEVVVGTVGQLRPEKHLDLLIESCASLAARQPLRLLIAGDGPEKAGLEQKARSLGFSDRVEFLGHCRDAADLYRRMDVFALTSQTEQMPLSILEAMASGLPVVSTNVGDVQKMLSEPNKPFIARSGPAFKPALAALVASAELRNCLGAANRARCVEVYSLREMLRSYEILYARALCQQPQGL